MALSIPHMISKEAVYIFLDMDDVLSERLWNEEVQMAIRQTELPKARWDLLGVRARAHHLNPHATARLHSLIDRVEVAGKKALIVLRHDTRI